ncbi:hypothetical protein CDCA_CDCA09G2604 [Cyanidium caldarium]|uniref:Uncharacterized protein n=1 Tax=Cyanidium caldarium TaxID=2771 RepID=A0AAV9IWD1_CYACA|nr:hypothetical protein CDCA_CDCA09G2604 [Cyanidium caldarium]
MKRHRGRPEVGRVERAAAPIKKGLLWDLREQYQFYHLYHTHWANRLVHVIFVPLLLWSAMLCLAQARWTVRGTPLDGATLLMAAYVLYYLRLSPRWGAAATLLFLLPLYVSARYAGAHWLHGPALYSVVGAAQLAGWSSQFLAHAWWEQRRPALLDNLVQAFASSPLFVFLEVVFAAGAGSQLQKQLLGAGARRTPRRTVPKVCGDY